MPNARHARSCAERGHRDDVASTASGGIRMRPTLGQKPLGQGISQTERALSLRNAMHDGVLSAPTCRILGVSYH